MDGEVVGLDIQHAAAAEAEHVLRVEVPGDAVSVRLLVEKLLRRDVIHL